MEYEECSKNNFKITKENAWKILQYIEKFNIFRNWITTISKQKGAK
jgi:hypothetical protein